MTLKDLCVKHPFYCAPANYLGGRDGVAENSVYKTWADFWAEHENDKIDWNLVFRFDVVQHDWRHHAPGAQAHYTVRLFFIQQRKGHFCPTEIQYVREDESAAVIAYLQKQFDRMQEIWQPFTTAKK